MAPQEAGLSKKDASLKKVLSLQQADEKLKKLFGYLEQFENQWKTSIGQIDLSPGISAISTKQASNTRAAIIKLLSDIEL